MTLLAFLIFLPLQILCIPLVVVGVGIVSYKQLVVSRRLGVSATGIEVIGGRWTMHWFEMRRDDATARLMAALPNASRLGLWMILFPLWATYKLTGVRLLYPRIPPEGTETIRDLVVGRTLYFDRIIERVAPDVEQFVVMGAGYDTRAYGGLRRDGLRFFELDQETTQNLKREGLAASGIPSDHVTFVTVDFARDDVFAKLAEAGYDPAKKSLFLWEGVTLFLGEEDVRQTLREIHEHSPAGSAIVADFYSGRFISYAQRARTKKTLEYTGEEVSFGLPFTVDPEADLERLAGAQGLTVGETVLMGRETDEGVLLAVVELRT